MHRSLNELATAVNARQSVRKEMWACCAIMRVGAFQVSDWIMSENVEVVAASQWDDVLVWHFVGKSFQLIIMVLRLECLLEDLE